MKTQEEKNAYTRKWRMANLERQRKYAREYTRKKRGSGPRLALSHAKRKLREYYKELKEKEKESAEIKREFRNLSIYTLAILGYSRTELAAFTGLHPSRVSFIINAVDEVSGWKS